MDLGIVLQGSQRVAKHRHRPRLRGEFGDGVEHQTGGSRRRLGRMLEGPGDLCDLHRRHLVRIAEVDSHLDRIEHSVTRETQIQRFERPPLRSIVDTILPSCDNVSSPISSPRR